MRHSSTKMADPAPPLSVPYTLHRQLRSGPHCSVWLGQSASGPVVVQCAESPAGRTQLQAEAALLHRTQHPNIARLHAAAPDGAWLATGPASGTFAHRWASRQPLAARIGLLAQLVDAVEYLHRLGIVHGDIRPDNIFVGPDGPRLHGICRSGQPWLTAAAGCLAPEVLLGEPCGRPGDTYALGATAYRILTGQPAFSARDPEQPLHSLPLPPSRLVPLPPRLEEQVLRMLARRPEARPRNLAISARVLQTSADDPPQQALVGLEPLRRVLRQRLVAATIGHEGSVLALIGPSGAGRAALIAEILAAARREQLTAIEAGTHRDARVLSLTLQRGPFALALDTEHPDARGICQAARGLRGLTLLRAERAPSWLPRADCLHLPKLDEQDVATMIAGAGVDVDRPADVHTITAGRPRAVSGYLFRRRLPRDLTTQERGLMLAAGPDGRSVVRLAARMGCSEDALHALAAPLLERGLMAAAGSGRLRATPP